MQKEQYENPMNTDGFEFVEFTSNDTKSLIKDFENMGFKPIARHKNKNVVLYRQNEINFLINLEEKGFAHDFAKQHGASACGMAFRVKDAKFAFERAVSLGATPVKNSEINILPYPAIYGIGGSILYLIDHYQHDGLFQRDFAFFDEDNHHPIGTGLTYIDHLTHNVNRGEMDTWAKFYETLFNFRMIRYFDIKGQKTGLVSRAMTSPCNKIRIPINESSDDKSQIQEFINEFHGEGIQHIALGTDDIYRSIEAMRKNHIRFLDTPDTYYKMLMERVPWHKEDIARLQKDKILLDGTPTEEGGLLLQIFTETMLGPVFFEIIQRKGNQGFGEGNFRALFEAIERDQMERGVL